MYKIVSSPNESEWCHFAYRNTIASFGSALFFYVEQLKLPTLAVTYPYALISSRLDYNAKAKLIVGGGLLVASLYMILKKSLDLKPSELNTMFNVNSVMINSFFVPIVLDGVCSKCYFLASEDYQQLPTPQKQDVNQLFAHQFIAELLFSSTFSVGVYALLDLLNQDPVTPFSDIKDNLCLIKTGFFMLGQLLMNHHDQLFQNTSLAVKDIMSANVRNLLYDKIDDQYVYLNDFFWSSMFYNTLLAVYSIVTKFQQCDGPPGPNGEPTCLGQSLAHETLYLIQMLFNLWVAVTFLKHNIITVQEEFPCANYINLMMSRWFFDQYEKLYCSICSFYQNDLQDASFSDDESKV